jgi:hypothetical protein
MLQQQHGYDSDAEGDEGAAAGGADSEEGGGGGRSGSGGASAAKRQESGSLKAAVPQDPETVFMQVGVLGCHVGGCRDCCGAPKNSPQPPTHTRMHATTGGGGDVHAMPQGAL